MSYLLDDYHGETAAAAPVNERVAFIRRTYAHLAGAILAFVGIEAALFATGAATDILASMFAIKGAWIGIMILFIVGGMGAQALARSRSSPGLQYAGLSLYVLLEVIIFLPILYIADLKFPGQYVAAQAGIVTLAVVAGLTVAVFASGKDFSFMGPTLSVLSFLALGVVIAIVIFGASSLMITLLCAGMVALASAFIIYTTSMMIHHYGTDQHVAASLELFASIATMFYYILMLFMNTRED